MDLRNGLRNENRKFVVNIRPDEWSRFYLYIPKAFVAEFKNEIPSEVLIKVENGDMFEVKFNSHCGCFIGLAKLIDRYCLTPTFFLFFEYCGGSEFNLYITNSTSVEIEYPIRAFYHCLPKLLVGIIPLEAQTIEDTGSTLLQDISGTLLKVTSSGRASQQFEIHIDESSVCIPEAVSVPENNLTTNFVVGEPVILQFNHRWWKVYVDKTSSCIIFKKGWLKFVSEVGLEVGDLCVLQRKLANNRYLVGILKDFFNTVSRFSGGQKTPSKFVKVVDAAVLEDGQIVVPVLFAEVYKDCIPEHLTLVNAKGIPFKAIYNKESSVIAGVREIISDDEKSEARLMVFKYVGNGVFHTDIFNKNSIDMYMVDGYWPSDLTPSS